MRLRFVGVPRKRNLPPPAADARERARCREGWSTREFAGRGECGRPVPRRAGECAGGTHSVCGGCHSSAGSAGKHACGWRG